MTGGALGGLTGGEVDALRAGFGRCDGWDFEQHLGCDGEAFVMATQELTGATLVVFGAAHRVEVKELRDDALRLLARFDDVEAAASFVAGGGLWGVLGVGHGVTH